MENLPETVLLKMDKKLRQYVFYMSLEIKVKLDTDLKNFKMFGSRDAFFSKGFTTSFFRDFGTAPVESDKFVTLVRVGKTLSMQSERRTLSMQSKRRALSVQSKWRTLSMPSKRRTLSMQSKRSHRNRVKIACCGGHFQHGAMDSPQTQHQNV